MFVCFYSVASLVLTNGEVTLNFEKGKTAAWRTQLCDIVSCPSHMTPNYTTGKVYISTGADQKGSPGCPAWGWVRTNTGADWGHREHLVFDRLTTD